MRIETDTKLDYRDVLIRPKRSRLTSRSEVELKREFKFPHAKHVWQGVPIIAANMDKVGTFEMAAALSGHGMMTALHKFYTPDEYLTYFRHFPNHNSGLEALNSVFFSFGITDFDLEKLDTVIGQDYDGTNDAQKFICLDVANGYSEPFAEKVQSVREKYPNCVIMAGNVVTGEMTEELILSGADIVKVGIGPGSVCTTRNITGVGYPQLSAVIECADAAHGLKGLVCADGGCTVPGDIAKAFAAGADFVMLGGMLAGHKENAGDIITRRFKTNEVNEQGNPVIEEKSFVEFYGMSSDRAMDLHYDGVAPYRASEGKRVELPYKGPVENTVLEILGGLRSTCTYVGAKSLRELSKRTTFVIVNRQLNEVFSGR